MRKFFAAIRWTATSASSASIASRSGTAWSLAASAFRDVNSIFLKSLCCHLQPLTKPSGEVISKENLSGVGSIYKNYQNAICLSIWQKSVPLRSHRSVSPCQSHSRLHFSQKPFKLALVQRHLCDFAKANSLELRDSPALMGDPCLVQFRPFYKSVTRAPHTVNPLGPSTRSVRAKSRCAIYLSSAAGLYLKIDIHQLLV